jgi:DNA-binding NtrC family response regulator
MEVVETGDEQQAREVIHQAPPTAVLTDLALPGGDGLGVLSAAKAADGTLPVIVATEMQCRP